MIDFISAIISYFLTFVLGAIVIQRFTAKPEQTPEYRKLLEARLNVYTELYYGAVCDPLHRPLTKEAASDYLKNLQNRIKEDSKLSMLYSRSFILELNKHITYLESGKSKGFGDTKIKLDKQIKIDFNEIKAILGYPARPRFLKYAGFWGFISGGILSILIGIAIPVLVTANYAGASESPSWTFNVVIPSSLLFGLGVYAIYCAGLRHKHLD